MQRFGIALLFAMGLSGCSGQAQPSLTGKVVHKEALEIKFLSDSIELQSVSNPTQFAYGQLSETGEFSVESLIDGKIVKGAPAGKYRVRFVVSDDDIEHKKELLSKIDKRFFNHELSGWNVDVPATNVVLELTGPKK
jgi:hypothetical protein